MFTGTSNQLCAGQNYFDVMGNLRMGTKVCTPASVAASTPAAPPDCSRDGETGCVATTTYAAALTTGLESKVLNGKTVAGIVGRAINAPSAAAVASCSSDIPIVCASDGQQNCTVAGVFKAANVTGVSSYDIRLGKTLGGVAGSLAFYTNSANPALFDRQAGSGALAGVDYYDNITDFNNAGTLPPQGIAGFATASGANWLRDPKSDTGAAGGVANDGLCNGTEDCVYQDLITNRYWSRRAAAAMSWEAAITYCMNLNYGGYSAGWRLPSQKDVLQAHIDGIWGVANAANLNLMPGMTDENSGGTPIWTSTTVSQYTNMAMHISFGLGNSNFWHGKTEALAVVCIR